MRKPLAALSAFILLNSPCYGANLNLTEDHSNLASAELLNQKGLYIVTPDSVIEWSTPEFVGIYSPRNFQPPLSLGLLVVPLCKFEIREGNSNPIVDRCPGRQPWFYNSSIFSMQKGWNGATGYLVTNVTSQSDLQKMTRDFGLAGLAYLTVYKDLYPKGFSGDEWAEFRGTRHHLFKSRDSSKSLIETVDQFISCNNAGLDESQACRKLDILRAYPNDDQVEIPTTFFIVQ